MNTAVIPAHLPERRTFMGAAGDELQALVYRPPVAAPCGVGPPVILDLHGGAWTYFSPAVDVAHCRALADAGYVVVAVSFRSALQAPWPGFFDDQRCALAWVRDHATDLGGDPGRIVVMGGSTGGHAALLLGLRGDASGRTPQAVVALWPVADVPGRYEMVRRARFDRLSEGLARRLEARDRGVDQGSPPSTALPKEPTALEVETRSAVMRDPGGDLAPDPDPVAIRLCRLDDLRRRHRRLGDAVGALLQVVNIAQGAVPALRGVLYLRLQRAHEAAFPEGLTQMAAASPTHALAAGPDAPDGMRTGALAPLLVVHASRDRNVTEDMSRRLVALWRARGGRARYELMRGVGHSFGNLASRASDDMVMRIAAFLRAEGLDA